MGDQLEDINTVYYCVADPQPPALPPPPHVSQNNNRCCRNVYSKLNVALMFAVAFFAILSTVFAVMYFTCDKKDKICSGSWKYLGYGCVGAKDNQYLELAYPGPSVFIGAVKLVHRKGTVGNGPSSNSNWGGVVEDLHDLAMIVTDLKNRIIYPSPRLVTVHRGGWYRLSGYSSTSPELVLSDFRNPKDLMKGGKIRIWYGEDLYDYTDDNNHGKTCMSVYVVYCT